MQRTASAVWRGGLKDGKGTISSQSGVLKDTQYSFSTRFENGIGTNPEELIAAAHAGCFTMALSAQLGNVSNGTPLTVVAAALQSISVTPTGRTTAAGRTRQFTATGTYADGSTQNLTTSATWIRAEISIPR